MRQILGLKFFSLILLFSALGVAQNKQGQESSFDKPSVTEESFQRWQQHIEALAQEKASFPKATEQEKQNLRELFAVVKEAKDQLQKEISETKKNPEHIKNDFLYKKNNYKVEFTNIAGRHYARVLPAFDKETSYLILEKDSWKQNNTKDFVKRLKKHIAEQHIRSGAGRDVYEWGRDVKIVWVDTLKKGESVETKRRQLKESIGSLELAEKVSEYLDQVIENEKDRVLVHEQFHEKPKPWTKEKVKQYWTAVYDKPDKESMKVSALSVMLDSMFIAAVGGSSLLMVDDPSFKNKVLYPVMVQLMYAGVIGTYIKTFKNVMYNFPHKLENEMWHTVKMVLKKFIISASYAYAIKLAVSGGDLSVISVFSTAGLLANLHLIMNTLLSSWVGTQFMQWVRVRDKAGKDRGSYKGKVPFLGEIKLPKQQTNYQILGRVPYTVLRYIDIVSMGWGSFLYYSSPFLVQAATYRWAKKNYKREAKELKLRPFVFYDKWEKTKQRFKKKPRCSSVFE